MSDFKTLNNNQVFQSGINTYEPFWFNNLASQTVYCDYTPNLIYLFEFFENFGMIFDLDFWWISYEIKNDMNFHNSNWYPKYKYWEDQTIWLTDNII